MGRTDFGNIHWRKSRSHTDADTSDEACYIKHHKIVEVSRGKGTDSKQHGSSRKQWLSSITVGQRTSHHGTHKAADKGCSHGYTLHKRTLTDAKEEFVERFCSADHDPIIAKEQTAHGADTADEQKVTFRFFHFFDIRAYTVIFGGKDNVFFAIWIWKRGEKWMDIPIIYPFCRKNNPKSREISLILYSNMSD